MNASVLKHLANVTVLIAGVPVPGMFKKPSTQGTLGIGSEDTRPNVMVASSAVPLEPVDSVIEVDGTPYSISAHEPDGTGMTRLFLGRTQ